MIKGASDIFYRYDYDRRDYKLTLSDLQSNNVSVAQFKKDVSKLPTTEQNYLYTFIIDEQLRNSLNIQDATWLYKTNDQEIEEIKIRWPHAGEKIVTSALNYSMRPAVVAAILDAERLIDPELDQNLDQESVRKRVSDFKHRHLKNNKNNYLWALAEYQLSFGEKKATETLKRWKHVYKNYGDNLRLSEMDGLNIVADDLTERQLLAGLTATAYVRESSASYGFIQTFIKSLHQYSSKLAEFSFFPQWLVSEFKNSELSSVLVSRINPWYWAGLANSSPEASAIQPLKGKYFEIYKKLAYLGLADSGLRNFTNAQLIDLLKYSGYIDNGLDSTFFTDRYFQFRHSGDLSLVFPEENAHKLLGILDRYIENIEINQKVITSISSLNTMAFRREYENSFFDIFNEALTQLKVRPQELMEIYYQDKKLTDWKMPKAISRKNYLYTLVVTVQETLNLKVASFEKCQVFISPLFNDYLKHKYKLGIENYDKKTQQKFIKDFFQRIELETGDQKINYDDFVDGFFGELNYKRLNCFLTDFMLESPSFGRPSYYITSGYGKRIDPVEKILHHHNGVDLQGNIGDPVYALASGKVVFAGLKGSYGNIVIIQQSDDTQIYYAHCDNIVKNKGDKIIAGEKIATIGMSGKATGPHIHIEYRKKGKPVPPINFNLSVWKALTEFYKVNRQKYRRG